ncbi:MAG TPA: lysylphosphatidylglycerol synthase transmembrane domain-containing protein [Oligoflexia bacterium]|nr:lysylphosphatidylglycerol synthase transmembrane domain-containing protein [Oligoflexia bacterium]
MHDFTSAMSSILSRLRLFLALFLISLLFWIVDFRTLLQALANIRIIYIVYLVALSFLLIWISCFKWQLFVKASGHQTGILSLMKYYTMSYFFNLFLPSSLGGDVARSVQLGHRLSSYESAFAATFIERITGFLAMILMGVAFVAAGSQATHGVEAAVLLVAFIALLGSCVCFSRRLADLFANRLRQFANTMMAPPRAEKLVHFMDKLSASIDFARNDLPLFAKAMVLSFVFHLCAVLNTYVCAHAVGWYEADFGGLCVVVPLILLVSVAPVTPSSVGLQEGAFLFFLQRIGASYAEGLSIGLLITAKSVIIACVGGLLYLFCREEKKRRPADAAQELPHPIDPLV